MPWPPRAYAAGSTPPCLRTKVPAALTLHRPGAASLARARRGVGEIGSAACLHPLAAAQTEAQSSAKARLPIQKTLNPDSGAGASPGPQPPLGLHTTSLPSAGETSSSRDLPRASARGGTSRPSPPRFPRPQPYLLAAEAMANQPHPPASPVTYFSLAQS